MTIIKPVPFFPNTTDDTHCLQAVLKMVLKYFQPEKNFSFDELDVLSDKVPGKWTWATRALINLHKMGYKLVNMEDFDYQSFSQNGKITQSGGVILQALPGSTKKDIEKVYEKLTGIKSNSGA